MNEWQKLVSRKTSPNDRLWVGSDLHALGKFQSIFYIDAQVANSAVDFGLAEKDLNGAKIAGWLVDDRRLLASKRVRAVFLSQEAGSDHPLVLETSIRLTTVQPITLPMVGGVRDNHLLMDEAARINGLSPAEKRVLRIAWDRQATNDEIATALSVTTETVKTHLKNIRSKTGLTKVAAARALADAEARPPIGGNSPWGRDTEAAAAQFETAVHDTRAVFEFEPRESAEFPPVARDERINTLNTLPRLVLIGLIAVVFGMMLLQSLTLLRPAGEVGQAIRFNR